MTTRRSIADPFLSAKNVSVEPEELIEPDAAPSNSTRLQAIRSHLSHYGNRALQSARFLATAVRDTIVHISTALAGSIVLLPVLIIVRGLYVLLHTLLNSAKDIVLSLARAVFDLVRVPLQAVSGFLNTFNKRLLFPVLKRVREDDTFAVIALAVLIAAGIGLYLIIHIFRIL